MPRKHFFHACFLFLIAIGLGWQLGAQMERQKYERERALLEERFGASGSGVTFVSDPEKEVDMTLLWTIWKLLDHHYVDPSALSMEKLRFGAVQGLVNAIGDPYSAFMTPKENQDFQKVLTGKLEGIGAELTLKDGNIVVVAPIKGSPASNAGLMPSDMIIKVDGHSLEGASLQSAVDQIRGEKGTTVTLTIFRPLSSEELTLPIVRDEIRVPSVESSIIDTDSGAVGYLSLNQFGESTARDARTMAKELKAALPVGLILDLRFNGGGYLDGAIDIASMFLNKGKIVSVHRRGVESESSFALGDAILPEIPLVILINEGTASASEIVAGALQDHKRATIIGSKSFGKGTVQEVIELPGGSSIRITVAKWKTPNGTDLGSHGVVPDISVPMKMEDYAEQRDPQKDAALEYLRGDRADSQANL